MREGLRPKKKVWCEVELTRKGKIRLTGFIEQIKDGKVVDRIINAATADYKILTAQGCAVGTFNAVNKARFTFSDESTAVVSTAKFSGGTGAEDYTVFIFSWYNSGDTKTINKLEIGYDLDGAGEKVYCEADGLSVPVPNGETIEYKWKLSADFAAGTVTDLYRFSVARMLYDGAFTVPGFINFIDIEELNCFVAAALEEGGDGVETYHQWVAEYTAPPGGATIDILTLESSEYFSYTQDDITDKSLDEGEKLKAHIQIDHDG